ncbi:MAG: flagellar basal body P-ring formation chaperone FlgA [Candidatus Zixiibacteriota bacterium]
MIKTSFIIFALVIVSIAFSDIVIQDAFIEYKLQNQLDSLENENMRILIVNLPSKAYLPDSNFTIDFPNPFKIGEHREVIYLQGDGWKRGIFWRYLCEKWGKYIVPKHNIDKGLKIKRNMLVEKTGWIPNYTAIRNYNEIIGKKAKKRLAEGHLLFENQIEKYYDIEPGDNVKLRWIKNGIELSSKGKAIERGIIGDEIRIRINRKVIEAEILAPKEVVIR